MRVRSGRGAASRLEEDPVELPSLLRQSFPSLSQSIAALVISRDLPTTTASLRRYYYVVRTLLLAQFVHHATDPSRLATVNEDLRHGLVATAAVIAVAGSGGRHDGVIAL